MKKETSFLKLAVLLIGLPILALCVVFFLLITKDAAVGSKKMAYVLYSILAIMYITVIPFFIGLYQAFKLLTYIDHNKAF